MDSLYRICFRKVLSLVGNSLNAAPGASCSCVLGWGQVLPHGIAEELLRALSDSKVLTDDLAAAYIAGFSRAQVPGDSLVSAMNCLNSVSFDNAGTLISDKTLKSLADNVRTLLQTIRSASMFYMFLNYSAPTRLKN